MLTDIFARRYQSRVLFQSVGPAELRLLVQGFRIVKDQLLPYYGADKKVDERAKVIWTNLHDRLTMELGWKELSPRFYSYQATGFNGAPYTHSGFYEMHTVCEAFVTQAFSTGDPDEFIKNRLSFIELAFRERENQIKILNIQLALDLQRAALSDIVPKRRGGMTIPGIPTTNVERTQRNNDHVNAAFRGFVIELNTRFEQARMPLNYHNGFIQITTDALTQQQIDGPFWTLVKEPRWSNVDTDMKEAIDRRDTGGRDPAFYAAKALESTIKIIAKERGWATGVERGASDFLNHLEKRANGPFIDSWERELMQKFFGGVRNELGHGPGGEPMPNLTGPQTDQAIELCMSWIKSLIGRL
jgi:hypothetical protein